MKRYIIERDLSRSNILSEEDLRRIVVQTNKNLNRISPEAHWVQSFFSKEKSFCVVTMDDGAIGDFLALGDFENTDVREITATIDETQRGGIRAVWTQMDNWAED